MPAIAELLTALEQIAPAHLAMRDDPIGLQLGNSSDNWDACVLALDVTLPCLEFAAEKKANAVISHHALIYHSLRNLAGSSATMQCIRFAIKNSISLIAAHTNWDTAEGGINDQLCELLGLQNIEPAGGGVEAKAFKLVTFVPKANLQSVLDAMADAGAGQIGLYRRCAFMSTGTGTFEPLPGAKPAIGDVGNREEVEEFRLEVRIDEHRKASVEKALLHAHPYETPAYDVWQVDNTEQYSLGRCGTLSQPMTLTELSDFVSQKLSTRIRAYGNYTKQIKRVGVIGGAGGSMWLQMKSAGCDALITGEVRHHEAVEAAQSGMCLLEAGHYATEHPGMEGMRKRLEKAFPQNGFHLFEPEMGRAGRT